MKKIREIVRLIEQSNLSQRQITRAFGISRPVVSDYISKIQTPGFTFRNIETMPDETLLTLLQENKPSDNKRHDFLPGKCA